MVVPVCAVSVPLLTKLIGLVMPMTLVVPVDFFNVPVAELVSVGVRPAVY